MVQTVDQFVTHALARKRIGFGDVRRLERVVLPAGLTCREDAEALLALDQAIRRADPAWGAYLAPAVKDFALGPGGVLDRNTADWLIEGPLRERTRTGLATASTPTAWRSPAWSAPRHRCCCGPACSGCCGGCGSLSR